MKAGYSFRTLSAEIDLVGRSSILSVVIFLDILGKKEERYRQEKNGYEALGWQSGIAFAATKFGYLRTSAGRVKATRIFYGTVAGMGRRLYAFLLRRV